MWLNKTRCRKSPFQWLCGLRRGSGIAGSNPTVGMDVCLLWVMCVVRHRCLRRADHPSKGVPSNMVYHWVWSRNLKNEAALASIGLLRQTDREKYRKITCNLNKFLLTFCPFPRTPCNNLGTSHICGVYSSFCVISHGAIMIYNRRSSSNLWSMRFCFSAVNSSYRSMTNSTDTVPVR